VLGGIPDRDVALAEIRRVLRGGGRLSVSEQFPDPDFVTRHGLRRELTARGFAEEKTRGWLFYTSTWSKQRSRTNVRNKRVNRHDPRNSFVGHVG